MTPHLTLLVAPAQEPITLAKLKEHLRVTHNDENDYLTDLITRAREMVEHETQRALLSQQWRIDYPCLTSPMFLPKAPLISVDSITYLDENNTRQTLSTALYRSVYSSNDPAVVQVYNTDWPSHLVLDESVQITATFGYASEAVIPGSIKQACFLVAGHLYENRELSAPIQLHSIPYGIQSLLAPHRYYRT